MITQKENPKLEKIIDGIITILAEAGVTKKEGIEILANVFGHLLCDLPPPEVATFCIKTFTQIAFARAVSEHVLLAEKEAENILAEEMESQKGRPN